MHLPSLFIAVSIASVTIALPQPSLEINGLESASNRLVPRAPAEEKVHSIASRTESKCFLPGACSFISGGSSSSATGSAAFTISGSISSSFSSGNSLQWGGLSQFGYKGVVSAWSNNFKGACQDFGIFINGFSGLTTTFQSSQFSWTNTQQAITQFGSDFSSFCTQLSSYASFGSFQSGKEIFQTYFIDCFKTFQSFFQVILNRYGESTFQKTDIFGKFQTGFKALFKFAYTVGLGSYSLLQSASINFTFFKKCGFTLESWIVGGISARHLTVEMF